MNAIGLQGDMEHLPDSASVGQNCSSTEIVPYMCKEVSSTCEEEAVIPVSTPERSAAQTLEIDESQEEASLGDTIGQFQKESSPLPLKIMNVVSLAGQANQLGVAEGANIQDTDAFNADNNIVPSKDLQKGVSTMVAEAYTCKFCECSMDMLDDIISHIGNTHKLRYWYTCPYCSSGCSRSKEQMVKHIQLEHPNNDENVPISITDEEKYFARPMQSGPKLKYSLKGKLSSDCAVQPVNEIVPAETGAVENVSSDLDDTQADAVIVESSTEEEAAEKDYSSKEDVSETTRNVPGMSEAEAEEHQIEPVQVSAEKSEILAPSSETLQEEPSSGTSEGEKQIPDESNVVISEGKSTSEKSCNTDGLLSSPPQPTRVSSADDDDIIFMGEQYKVKPTVRPVGQIRPTMIQAPVRGHPGNFRGRGRGIVYRALRPGFSRPSRPTHHIPFNSSTTPIHISPDKTDHIQISHKPDEQLDMYCENIQDHAEHDDTVTEDDDDVIVTETQSSVVSVSPLEQPLDLHQSPCEPPEVGVHPTVEPEDLSIPMRSKSSTADEPQDLSTAPRPSSTPFQTGLECPQGGRSEQQNLTQTGSDIQTPPPAHQVGGRQHIQPILIKPLESRDATNTSFPRGGPPGKAVTNLVTAVASPIVATMTTTAKDQLGTHSPGMDKQKRYITIAPKPTGVPQSVGYPGKPSNSPVLRHPLPAHSHPNTGVIRGTVPLQTFSSSALLQVPLSARVGAPTIPAAEGGASGTTHRPVTKTMPPLIQVLPRSSQKETSLSAPPRHPPPPLINTAPGQLHRRGSQEGRAQNISDVAGTGAVMSLPESALSSLVSMTNRAAPEVSSPHPWIASRPAGDTPMKDPELGEAEDEEAAKKMFNVFNLAPRMRQVRPTAPLPHQPPKALAMRLRGPAGPTPPGLDKWRQFQSQRRPAMRGRPLYAVGTNTYRPLPPSGSVGMTAAAFQQAHMRRGVPRVGQPPYMVPRPYPLATAAAAVSFMPRQPAPTSTAQSGAIPPLPRRASASPSETSIECPYCQFTAADADSIHDHILSHAPNIQWTCPYCPLPNRMTKSTVTKHIENCHPNMDVVYIPYGVPLH